SPLVTKCVSALLGLWGASALAEVSTTCTLATLRGTYAFSGTGTDGGMPYSTSGRATYDGRGHIHYYQLWDEAGVMTRTRAPALTPWTPIASPTQPTDPTIIGPILLRLMAACSTSTTITTPA